MTSFAHVGYPTQHPGLVRAERAVQSVRSLAHRFHVSARLQAWLKRQAAERRQAAEDAKLWQVALNDDRVMADLSRAMSAAAVVRNLKTYY
jgi:hypothetical protein